jgi:uncharacterized membrane protein YfcA
VPEDPRFYLFAIPAVILIGLAKGGFSGLGALGTPLIALGIDLLPILIVQDVVGVIAYRSAWDGAILKAMLPGAVVGIALGYAFAASVSEAAVMAVLGGISILFGSFRLWVERGHVVQASSTSPLWVGSIFGLASGFTSQIAHAGGPPFQMWVMPRRLPRDIFVGTTALFFAIINWIKVPAYFALGQFSSANLSASLILLPLAIISSLAGVWLVRRVPPERFYTIVYLLMIAAGTKLLFDGLAPALA